MNITSSTLTITPTVVNPPTDALRRENSQREVIAQPAAAQHSAAEKGVASEKERAKTPAQNNEEIDFENIRKQAELANKTISGGEGDSSQDPEQEQGENQESSNNQESKDSQENSAQKGNDSSSSKEDIAEQQVISDLKQRDKEVRAHESAHASVGGSATGSPSYSFEIGPDGKKYAVEGEVSVDLTPVNGDPRATITKMQKVYSAALAPISPSSQDKSIANSAAQQIAQAQSEIMAAAKSKNSDDEDSNNAIKAGSGNDFDRHIKKTMNAQEAIAPSRSDDVDQRAQRIETFYSTIIAANTKPPRHQFELTA